MKKIHWFFAALLLFAVPALAQPGPGPTPNPWVFNGAQIYYNQGCVTVSTSTPGPCHGAGSFTTVNLYATGILSVTGHTTLEGVTSTGATGTGNIVYSASPTLSGTVAGTAVLPLTGLKTIATNTILGNSTSGTAAVVAQAMSSCSTSTSALIWTTNTGFGCNALSSSLVTTLSFGTTGLTPNSATSGAITVAGMLVAGNGGTGIASYAVGDLLYASGATTLSALADVATGNALISGGVTTAPSWGKIGLTTHVSGTLAVGNGGTGAATFTANGVLYGNTTSAFGVTAAGTTGQYFKGVTSSAPAWGTLASDAVTTISFGTTGLTPSSGTSGAVTVAGTLIVANGGTGAATLTGVLKGTGTTAFVAATAGTDFVAPGTATTFTAKQTFSGTSSNVAAALVNAVEPATISATAATGTINYDACTQSVLYYTTNASANWTENFRCSSGTSLNTAMATGDVITVVHMVTQGGTAYYNNVVTVDGGANTPKWQGGTAPTAGNINGIDIYTYSIIKTGSAAFTVLVSQVQYK